MSTGRHYRRRRAHASEPLRDALALRLHRTPTNTSTPHNMGLLSWFQKVSIVISPPPPHTPHPNFPPELDRNSFCLGWLSRNPSRTTRLSFSPFRPPSKTPSSVSPRSNSANDGPLSYSRFTSPPCGLRMRRSGGSTLSRLDSSGPGKTAGGSMIGRASF